MPERTMDAPTMDAPTMDDHDWRSIRLTVGLGAVGAANLLVGLWQHSGILVLVGVVLIVGLVLEALTRNRGHEAGWSPVGRGRSGDDDPGGDRAAVPTRTAGDGRSPVAGWYHDPLGRHRLRLWDGARWTKSVR